MWWRYNITWAIIMPCTLVQRLHTHDTAVTVSADAVIESSRDMQPYAIPDKALQQVVGKAPRQVVGPRVKKGFGRIIKSMRKVRSQGQEQKTSLHREMTVSADALIKTVRPRQRQAFPDGALQHSEVIRARVANVTRSLDGDLRTVRPQVQWHTSALERGVDRATVDMQHGTLRAGSSQASVQTSFIKQEPGERADSSQTAFQESPIEQDRFVVTEDSNFDRSRLSKRTEALLLWIKVEPARIAAFLAGLAGTDIQQVMCYVTGGLILVTGAIVARFFVVR